MSFFGKPFVLSDRFSYVHNVVVVMSARSGHTIIIAVQAILL